MPQCQQRLLPNRNTNILADVVRIPKGQRFVISRSCFEEDRKEMHKD